MFITTLPRSLGKSAKLVPQSSTLVRRSSSSPTSGRRSREHNDANVLTLGASIIDEDAAFKIVDKWLATPFAGGRHERRVQKIAAIEREDEGRAAKA